MKKNNGDKYSSRTLLLTGTIAPSNGIKKFNYINSLDPGKRLKDYENSIKYYTENSIFEKIVFCENSNYSCEKRKNEICRYVENNNKSLEILQFQGNVEKTLELSYSYGEGECLDYAFKNSKRLKHSNSWWKITGRYIIKNIDDVIKSSDKYENLLFKWLRPLGFFAIDTSLFKVSNYAYEKYLYDAKHDITKENNKCIENIFYDRIRNKSINCGKLKVLPKKDGYWDSGYYEKIYHRYFLKIGLWNQGTLFCKMLDTFMYNDPKKIFIGKKILRNLGFKIQNR